LRPPRYISPPILLMIAGEKPGASVSLSALLRLDISGEKPMSSPAKMAWHPASSCSVVQRGDLITSECPASGVIGILAVEEGKRVVKTFGDHAPAVITRRVHGTIDS
jgi:hypothetical protein